MLVRVNMKALAKQVSSSFIFRRARKLYECNTADWNYPLTKWQKLMVGSYMILRDYADGFFPPRFDDEQTTFDGETAFYNTLQTLGKTEEELYAGAMQKPFWHGLRTDLLNYADIQAFFHQCGVNPPMRLLEVGCGSGWTAEFLAASGFHVTATTLDESAGEMIERRRTSLIDKGVPHDLQFRASAMEYIHETVTDMEPFDAIYVYEALHHAHDWKKSIESFSKCLKPGGWCFIFNEPNLIHTFVSYRIARLSNTHEIGISPMALKRQLKSCDCRNIHVLKHRWHGFVRPSWLAARIKPDF